MQKSLTYKPKDGVRLFLWVLLFSYLLSFAVSIIYASVAAQMEIKIDEFLKLKPVVYINAFLMEIFFVAIFFIYLKKKKISFINANLLNRPLSWQQIAIVIILAGFLYVLSNPFCASFESFLTYCGYELNALDITLDNPLSITLCVLFLGILPAFIEEFIFRGAIMQGLKPYGKWVAILISALLFTLIHGNVQQTIYQFGCGVLFGLLVWETGSIWASVILHASNNTLLVILQSLVDCGVIEMTATPITWLYVVIGFILVAVLIGIIIFAFKLIKKYQPKSKKVDIIEQFPEQNSSKNQENTTLSNSHDTNVIANTPSFSQGCKALCKDKDVLSDLLWGIAVAVLIILINLF